MIKVTSYQTSDGTLFRPDQQEDARDHELMIQFRGLVQSSAERSQGHYTSTDIAQILCKNRDKVHAIISSFKKGCGGMKGGRRSKVEA